MAHAVESAEDSAQKPTRQTLKKQWIAILVGIPAMILLYYIIIGLLKLVAS